LVKDLSRSFLGAILALFVGGCGLQERGALVLVEPGWEAEVLATEKDGLSSPDGLRWAGDRLLIADEGGRAVRVWRDGQGVKTLADRGDGLGAPEDLVEDAAGNIYFTDDKRGGVWRTDAKGKTVHLADAAKGVGATEGIALSSSGVLLVGDGDRGRVVRVGGNGEVKTVIPPSAGIRKPESLAFAPDGSLFIADNDADVLYVVRQGGRVRAVVANLEGFSPEGLYHSGKALFITDRKNGKLYRYTPEEGLTPLIVFAGDLAKIQGIAGDEAGNLYVTIQADIGAGRGYVLRLSKADGARSRAS
jgi:sugar lactone lactonase YvrE